MAYASRDVDTATDEGIPAGNVTNCAVRQTTSTNVVGASHGLSRLRDVLIGASCWCTLGRLCGWTMRCVPMSSDRASARWPDPRDCVGDCVGDCSVLFHDSISTRLCKKRSAL
eukprot:1742721-Prymnesium_polylepis.1